MKFSRSQAFCRLFLLVLLAQSFVCREFFAQSVESLRILVLPGRETTYPIVQIQDERGLPVPGADVTFRIPDEFRGASFGQGRSSVTTKTDTQGLASATTLRTLSGGTVPIQVETVYQGRSASTSITQVYPLAETRRSRRKWMVITLAAGSAVGVALAKSRSNSASQVPATVLGVGSINAGRP